MRKTSQPVSVADAIPPVIAKLDAMAAKSRLFTEEMRPQFDAQPAFVPCKGHPDTMRLRDWDKTLSESHAHEEFRMVYAECPVCAEIRRVEDENRKWAKRGVPYRLADATLENFVVEGRHPSLLEARNDVQAWLANAKRCGGFLVMLGNPGLGKGHLAVGALKVIGTGLYVTHPDLITELRTSYTLHNTEALLTKYRNTRCLVLDELGVSGGGKDEQPVLYQILADRHDAQLPTIITSNEEAPTVKEILGHRIMDRIREDFVQCKLKGESYRTKKGE